MPARLVRKLHAQIRVARRRLRQQQEFLAAPAGDAIRIAQLARGLAREGAQGFIAHSVPEGIVDPLEMIDVGNRHGKARSPARAV